VKVTAVARRSGDWWAVEVEAIAGLFTQAKRLDQVEAMVQDAARMLGAGEVDVTVRIELSDEAKSEVLAAKKAASRAARVQAEAAAKAREVARHLRQSGLTVRDVAMVLEVSPQRVSQLAPTRADHEQEGHVSLPVEVQVEVHEEMRA
jgi:predicted XRE-type DNA-binding protein